MTKGIFSTIFIAIISIYGVAQTPQFAVVRPDGTTYICPSWDSAYNKSQDGDNVYLPGVGLTSAITNGITINKRLFLYGTGHHPDSSATTGKTIILGGFSIQSGASGGSIEGVNITGGIGFHFTGKRLNGFLIKRCRIPTIQIEPSNNPPLDSFPTNILVTECIVSTIYCSLATSGSQAFTKNLILGQMLNPNNCTVKNNAFLFSGSISLGTPFNNSTFENNIFLQANPIQGSSCNNNYYNNLKLNGNSFLNGCTSNSGIETGTMSVTYISDIFVSYNPASPNFPYSDDYHLKPGCVGINAGSDGTDVGIYGTVTPTSLGWVPSNPHIYFKQVSDQTNNNGQLQVQFKIKTGN